MKSHLNLSQSASVQLGRGPSRKPVKKRPVLTAFDPRGRFEVEHWRNGMLLQTHRFPNGIVNEGKDHLFDSTFDAATQITIWYMLLIDLTGFTALADDDTYDDINQAGNGWDEFTTYTDPSNADSAVTRPPWSPDPASAESITNSTQTVFDITGAGTVKGLGIVGGGAASNTKGDHAADATLWATALFDQGDTAVVNADQLKVTYTISA